MHQIQPTVGQWYLRPETGQKFEVIDIDDGDGMIEIQDEEGALDEIDADAWFTVAVEATNQPQDGTSFDNESEIDEADGGESVESDPLNRDDMRVASDELLNDAEGADDGEWDKGMETPPAVLEEDGRPRP